MKTDLQKYNVPIEPNTVYFRMVGFDLELIGFKYHDYNGTLEDMADVAGKLQAEGSFLNDASQIQSQSCATDENGNLKYIISPNCLHIAERGTQEADYILGFI